MGVLRLGIIALTDGISTTFSHNNVMNLIHKSILVYYISFKDLKLNLYYYNIFFDNLYNLSRDSRFLIS